MWNDSTKENNKAWPGVAMTKVSGETDVYCYTVPDDKFDMIIFNGSGQTDDLKYPGGNKLYDYATRTWRDYSADPVPVISVSNEGGSFKDSVNVSITVTDATSAYYSIDGGSHITINGSVNLTIGANIAEGTSVKLDISATNSYGTVSKSCTYKKRSTTGPATDGSTAEAISGNYATNPNNGYGKRKTITVDGDKSDWDSSMLIAQGAANDDPRVYAHWSMHEIAIDDYAMYAAWDDTNLYIMYEMANVQDVVASGEDFPLTQGNLWIYNLPVFMYIFTGEGNITHGTTAGGTLWDTGTTVDANADHVIAYSTNASNGPFIYTANDDGNLEPDVLVKKGAASGINVKWGSGKTLSGKLIPVGGGKDSIVTLNLLKGQLDNAYAYQINHRDSSEKAALLAGIPKERILEPKRTLDPNMLRLNKEGYLNGHTPFSAIVAFSSVLTAYLNGIGMVILSNESSASESTVSEAEVNHQYSKSYQFERDFFAYERDYLRCGVRYFSLLRPLTEFQIARYFASCDTKYHEIFRSCNAGAKQDKWCGHCAKCLFVSVILSPFLPLAEIARLLGADMFNMADMEPVLQELCGALPNKPFECVGSRKEVNLSLCLAIERAARDGAELPLLLKQYQASPLWKEYAGQAAGFGQEWDPQHNLPEDLAALVKRECVEAFR
jgi:hypothetical protein